MGNGDPNHNKRIHRRGLHIHKIFQVHRSWHEPCIQRQSCFQRCSAADCSLKHSLSQFPATSIALGLGCRSLYANSLSLLLLLLLPFPKEQNLISPCMLSCHGWFWWWSTDEWISSYKWAKASGSVPEIGVCRLIEYKQQSQLHINFIWLHNTHHTRHGIDSPGHVHLCLHRNINGACFLLTSG